MQTLFVHFIQEVFSKPLFPIMFPTSPQSLVLSERELAWMAVKEQFDFLATIMDKNCVSGDGIVAMGHEVTYADFALCAVLIWIERMTARDGWARIRTWNGGRWNRLWDRCRDYMDEF
jgi:glutathione S-transferase